VNREIVACLIAISAILVVAMFTGCIEKDGAISTPMPTPTSTFLHTPSPMSPGNMQLTSPDFENGTLIPTRFTCDGADINPSLVIAGIPAEAQSLALIVDDPDAPGGPWVHWVVYNIPVVSRIDKAASRVHRGLMISAERTMEVLVRHMVRTGTSLKSTL
jgi:phosphatidylethanolamine-binding protein (PEBP) family uncharacterized protein